MLPEQQLPNFLPLIYTKRYGSGIREHGLFCAFEKKVNIPALCRPSMGKIPTSG